MLLRRRGEGLREESDGKGRLEARRTGSAVRQEGFGGGQPPSHAGGSVTSTRPPDCSESQVPRPSDGNKNIPFAGDMYSRRNIFVKAELLAPIRYKVVSNLRVERKRRTEEIARKGLGCGGNQRKEKVEGCIFCFKIPPAPAAPALGGGGLRSHCTRTGLYR